jgi:hypothetical protein
MQSEESSNSLVASGHSEKADSKVVTVANKPNRMKGMKIRDEFICPITYELMREPVVASDGHTYEKAAIEKWLKTHQISPRNGEPIGGLPNIQPYIQPFTPSISSYAPNIHPYTTQ